MKAPPEKPNEASTRHGWDWVQLPEQLAGVHEFPEGTHPLVLQSPNVPPAVRTQLNEQAVATPVEPPPPVILRAYI